MVGEHVTLLHPGRGESHDAAVEVVDHDPVDGGKRHRRRSGSHLLQPLEDVHLVPYPLERLPRDSVLEGEPLLGLLRGVGPLDQVAPGLQPQELPELRPLDDDVPAVPAESGVGDGEDEILEVQPLPPPAVDVVLPVHDAPLPPVHLPRALGHHEPVPPGQQRAQLVLPHLGVVQPPLLMRSR